MVILDRKKEWTITDGALSHAPDAAAAVVDADGPCGEAALTKVFRGNHLSNAACLTHVFFKSGE